MVSSGAPPPLPSDATVPGGAVNMVDCNRWKPAGRMDKSTTSTRNNIRTSEASSRSRTTWVTSNTSVRRLWFHTRSQEESYVGYQGNLLNILLLHACFQGQGHVEVKIFFSVTRYLRTYWRDFNDTCAQIITMRLVIIEKIFKVKGQRSRTQRDLAVEVSIATVWRRGSLVCYFRCITYLACRPGSCGIPK